MSNRETQQNSSVQSWRGVDQRTQPTLVQDGFFTMSRGVFFGLGDNAERLPGKEILAYLDEPIFQLFINGNNLLIQTMENLYSVALSEILPQRVQVFTFNSVGDTSGFFYFIGTGYGQSSWSNPSSGGLLTTTSSAIFTGVTSATTDRTTAQIIVNNVANSWIVWDFGTAHVTVTDYLLRGRSDFSGDINPRNWKLQGSNNNSSWTDIDVRVNDTTVGPGAATWGHFTCTDTGRWRYLRLLQNGVNAAGNNFLVNSEAEFYGTFRY